MFGENHQIIVSTHIDKDHIHNHIAVCPYNLDGKQWYGNYKTLLKARKISDTIALEHGLHIIENPKHKNTMKYNEWLARKNGTSWKQLLCGEIDKIILDDNVRNVTDLAEKLSEKGYVIRQGKYLSIKAPKQKYAIRSFRLGDGYSVQDLEYRILHKEKEISIAAIERYSGVQREYAICMRQMQINVFYKKEKRTTYSDLRRSAELLNYLSANNITSVSEFENKLNSAAEKFQSVSDRYKKMSEQVKKVEQIIKDGKIYLDLSDKDFLTSDEKAEYKKVAYVEEGGINCLADLNDRQEKLEKLKIELSETEKQIEPLRAERDTISEYYKAYQKNIAETSYDDIQRQVEMLQSEREERSDKKTTQSKQISI